MLHIHRDPLPDRFLLIPASDSSESAELDLSRSLHRASRSDKPSIWLDCSLITDQLSEDAIDILLAYSFMLRQQGRQLVLCHANEAIQAEFARHDEASQPSIVSTLLDQPDTESGQVHHISL
ncbi:hypothetical protein H8B15_00535 [Hymenobacter sp. BT507]|uniref:STAS domain-containing protein n=1 Tax=Hymenobacter citatus TaxID=2763506 RepID=A0ABR7MEA2_9BACT|nr:hypothetical protein [Hymenobacter citatus]MBC6609390.1 hypothetical protein [Hymenobacter citatus]